MFVSFRASLGPEAILLSPTSLSVCGWWFMVNLCNYWANCSSRQGQVEHRPVRSPTTNSFDSFSWCWGTFFAWQPDAAAPDISQLCSIKRQGWGGGCYVMGSWLMCDEWCLLFSSSFPFILLLNRRARGCDIAESNKDVAADQGYLIRMKKGCPIGLACLCKCWPSMLCYAIQFNFWGCPWSTRCHNKGRKVSFGATLAKQHDRMPDLKKECVHMSVT